MKNKTLFVSIAAAAVLGAAVLFFAKDELFGPKTLPVFDSLSHPAKKASFWKDVMARPIERRLIDAPPMLIDYINKDNAAQGWPAETRSIKLEEPFKSDLRRALTTLPDEVLKILDESLAFITVVRELGSSGYSDFLVSDDEGFAPHGFIVLDVKALDRKANEWMTWKESSPFSSEPGWSLSGIIEDPERDDRVYAIQYLLLHELGHVVSFSLADHPRHTEPREIKAQKIGLGFIKESWRWFDGRAVSKYDDDLSWRGTITYYARDDRKQPMSLAATAYTDLSKTNFTTLYGTTSYDDDFADSFASFVHTELQGRPWEIRIEAPNREPLIYNSCWKEERCRQKRLILKAVLGL